MKFTKRGTMRSVTIITGEQGFTLLELLIVLLIMGVLSSLAYFNMDFYRNARVDSRTKELFADLQRSRGDAIASGATTTSRGRGFRLGSSNSYTLFVFSDNNDNYQYDGTSEETSVTTKNLPSGQLIIKVNSPTPAFYTNTIIFDRFGFVRHYDPQQVADFTLSISDTNLKVPYTRCIRVTQNKVREGFWNAATNTCTEQ